MLNKTSRILFFSALIISLFTLISCTPSQKNNPANESYVRDSSSLSENPNSAQSSQDISALTAEKVVVDYVKKHHQLPDYYVTKSKARSQGWSPSRGNLCDVLPRKAIGGDRFGNRERKLPQGKRYYEADINYDCGRRDVDRLIYTLEGEVWVTYDHYQSFNKK